MWKRFLGPVTLHGRGLSFFLNDARVRSQAYVTGADHPPGGPEALERAHARACKRANVRAARTKRAHSLNLASL